jgi:hypothetical protein
MSCVIGAPKIPDLTAKSARFSSTAGRGELGFRWINRDTLTAPASFA